MTRIVGVGIGIGNAGLSEPAAEPAQSADVTLTAHKDGPGDYTSGRSTVTLKVNNGATGAGVPGHTPVDDPVFAQPSPLSAETLAPLRPERLR
ncbi:MAG: hypothetical protein V2I76_14595 [Roseobacter sp.]|jgi:hypothetical protein|nr:hypothetical protein [Roseobacter sp.]